MKVNEHKNCKSMNEARFFIFWLYQMHLHNLDIEGLAGVMSNPHVSFRWEQIKISPVDLDKLRKPKGSLAPEVTEVMNKLDQLRLSTHKCPLCEESFEEEASLKAHITNVHPETHSSNPRECKECGKVLGSAQSVIRHVLAVHRSCKNCKLVFESSAELNQHKKIHTTCELCGTDWGYPSKLKSHMETHK